MHTAGLQNDITMEALIVIDLQNEFFSQDGFLGDQHYSYAPYESKFLRFFEYCKCKNLPVFFIRSNYENAKIEPGFKAHLGNTCCIPSTLNYEFIPEVQPIVSMYSNNIITKSFYSCFHKTSLYERLNALCIHKIYFSGLMLNNSIKKSAEHAINLGFEAILLDDLVLTERPYVYTTTQNKILHECVQVGIQKISTNLIMNTYGESSYLIDLNEDGSTQNMFTKLLESLNWECMYNRGNPVPRLLCIQSLYRDILRGFNVSGNEIATETRGIFKPLYRHPNDEEPHNNPMANIVMYIKDLVEQKTGLNGYNHVLIQLYRDGQDNISPHTDKSLDIDPATPIVNVSFGYTRVMTLTSKDVPYIVEKVILRDGTAFVMDTETNRKWLHEIKKDGTCVDNKKINENNTTNDIYRSHQSRSNESDGSSSGSIALKSDFYNEDGDGVSTRVYGLGTEQGPRGGGDVSGMASCGSNDITAKSNAFLANSNDISGCETDSSLVPQDQSVHDALHENHDSNDVILTTADHNHKHKAMTQEEKDSLRYSRYSRISLTFRKINTYVRLDEKMIIGQGSPYSVDDYVHGDKLDIKEPVARSDTTLYQSFVKENKYSHFTWLDLYDGGFNCM